MLFSKFGRSVDKRFLNAFGIGALLFISIYFVSLYQKEGTKSNPIRFFSVDEEKALVKLNLLRDDDPLLSTIAGSECTLDYMNNNKLQQNHPCVVQTIQRFFIHPPSQRNVPYQLKTPENNDPSQGQAVTMRNHLNNMKDGFFIECGAADGEFYSNTLFMERHQNWTGLLIEADNGAFGKLLATRRKAYAAPVCLSLEPYPTKVLFNQHSPISYSGGQVHKPNISYEMKNQSPLVGEIISSQCFPLYSILLAINRTKIDFLSLDVEGHEAAILKTIPWHKVDIKTMIIEILFVTKEVITDVLYPVGYYVFYGIGTGDLFLAKNESFTGRSALSMKN